MVAKMIPLPHQLVGADWLASLPFAMLGDAPRVGKTGAAIMAADKIGAARILVVTTASGRGVWKRGFDDWSVMGRPLQIMTPKDKLKPETQIVVIGWPSVGDSALRLQLLARAWDLAIFDESHAAKNFEAKRTQATYGVPVNDAETLATRSALSAKAARVWCLSGTLLPNSPFDIYPSMRAHAADRLTADPAKGWPDVTRESEFKKRYCKIRPKKLGNGPWARRIDVIVGGQNLDELRQRTEGLILLRTQQDVGIRAPIYETFPLVITETQRRQIEEAAGGAQEIMAAIDADETKKLEMHLGPLRRLTGAMKAKAIVEAVKEEFESGLDRIVLAYWHKEVAEILIEGLHKYGVVGIDGSTSAVSREENVAAFRNGTARVFLGQILAAGEAIDLSAASELIFVEMSFVPKDLKQMSLRITNHGQTRQTRVRVATLDGSIDDAIGSSLLRKWASINEVLAK